MSGTPGGWDQWREGFDAAKRGKPEEANPYKEECGNTTKFDHERFRWCKWRSGRRAWMRGDVPPS